MFRESSEVPSRRSSTSAPGRNAALPLMLCNQYGSFRDLVVFAYPGPKPEVALAELTKKHQRTCERWLDGTTEPPASVLALVLAEFFWRLGQRRKR